ncbi:MAG: sulfotransferase domain-containing protein [bacterium]|nr:sulfotransferase domain-containing protein [bacterium]
MPYFPQVKYIVLGRDPRDVFMSFLNHYYGYITSAYYLYNNTPGRNGSKLPVCPEDIHICWKNWISKGWFEWEKEGFPFWGNMHHTQTWWNYRHLNNIQFFHYADLLENKAEEIKRLADYINISLPNEAIEAIIDITDIRNMRQRGRKSGTIFHYFKNGSDTFFNKGTNKRWKNILSEDELLMYKKKKREVLTQDCASWLKNGRKSFEKKKAE